MTTSKAKLAGLALIVALCAGFTLGLTAPAGAGWDEAEFELGFGVPLLGKRTPLTKGRCIVASIIGRHTLIKTSPSRGRQAQREPGAHRRDKREAREFGYRCGHGLPPCGGCPRVYRKSY